MKKENGITLIALVITIIVLLILAGVTIATLTGDNGLLQKAQTAKETNEEATALEKIKVEVAGSYGLDGKINKENLNKNLSKISGLTYKQQAIDLNDLSTIISTLPATVKLNNYTFSISEEGDVNIIQWIYDNGSYINAKTGQIINVGDTVKYETILNENAVDSAKLNTLKNHLQDYSGDSTSSDNASIDRDTLTWKVLDVKDGKIRLISLETTTKTISLKGIDGYNNAVYLLDEACRTLYGSNKGTSQNLKIEDIEEKINKTNFDYKQYINTGVTPNIKYGETREFTSNLQYPNIYPSEVGCKGIDGNSGEDNNIGTIEVSSQTSRISGATTASSRLKVTQTSWYKSMEEADFIDLKYYNLFIKNGSMYPTYWLSSRCVDCVNSYVNFFFFFQYYGIRLLSYDGKTQGYARAFRPVITLNFDVQLEPDGTNTWKIVE